jgi:hypothetical protein
MMKQSRSRLARGDVFRLHELPNYAAGDAIRMADYVGLALSIRGKELVAFAPLIV